MFFVKGIVKRLTVAHFDSSAIGIILKNKAREKLRCETAVRGFQASIGRRNYVNFPSSSKNRRRLQQLICRSSIQKKALRDNFFQTKFIILQRLSDRFS